MPRLKFKQKCKICHKEWTIVGYKEYPICQTCHMKQVLSEKVEEKKYNFLNIEDRIYHKSRFLRNIRVTYNRYKELTVKQIAAFKKTVKDIKNNKPTEENKSAETKELS